MQHRERASIRQSRPVERPSLLKTRRTERASIRQSVPVRRAVFTGQHSERQVETRPPLSPTGGEAQACLCKTNTPLPDRLGRLDI